MDANYGANNKIVTKQQYDELKARIQELLESKNLHSQLETAIAIAVEAHKGLVDKAGMPYILHPLRVMGSVDSIDEKIVAVLHDVVEDTSISFEDLLDKGIESRLIHSLRLLTHDKDVAYEDYIKDIAINPIARNVKLADLKDNSNLDRLKEKTKKDYQRLEKYKEAIFFLENFTS